MISIRTASDRNPNWTTINTELIIKRAYRKNSLQAQLETRAHILLLGLFLLQSIPWLCLSLVGFRFQIGSFYWVDNMAAGSPRQLICFHLSHFQGKKPFFQFTVVDRSWMVSDWLGLGTLSTSKPISMAERRYVDWIVLGHMPSVLWLGDGALWLTVLPRPHRMGKSFFQRKPRSFSQQKGVGKPFGQNKCCS